MAKRTGLSQAACCWCSPVWLVLCFLGTIFTNNKIWVGTNNKIWVVTKNKNFLPTLWTLRNVQSLQTGGSIVFEAGLWTSPPVTGRAGHSFCRRKMQVALGKVTEQVCVTENCSPSCTPDAPLSTQRGTKLPCHHEQTHQCLLHQSF